MRRETSKGPEPLQIESAECNKDMKSNCHKPYLPEGWQWSGNRLLRPNHRHQFVVSDAEQDDHNVHLLS